MGDLIPFPLRTRGAARDEEPAATGGGALLAARSDEGEEWLDRLTAAIALGPAPRSGDGADCDVVPIRNR